LEDRIVGYANGILELARAEGEVERVENELFDIAQALDKSAELRSSLTDPQLPIERKQAVIEELLGGRATPLTVGLIQFIISQGRISELPEMARAVAERAAETRSKALAEVRSAVPLDDKTVERLAAALSKATGKKVEVKVIVDESVIGGIVARIGDTVIDGSIARRMDSLRQALNTR
jgi:F-type H+-transporting ATPase subunit delta